MASNARTRTHRETNLKLLQAKSVTESMLKTDEALSNFKGVCARTLCRGLLIACTLAYARILTHANAYDMTPFPHTHTRSRVHPHAQ